LFKKICWGILGLHIGSLCGIAGGLFSCVVFSLVYSACTDMKSMVFFDKYQEHFVATYIVVLGIAGFFVGLTDEGGI
jgi:hypothetical protein